MTRLLYLIILPLLLAQTAWGGSSDYAAFSLDWSGSGGTIPAFYSPLTTTTSVLTPPRAYPGTAGTFTRASSQYVTDHEGVLREVKSGSVAVEGSRVVTNLLTYSEDLSNAAWVKANTSTVTGTNVINLPAVLDVVSQVHIVNAVVGTTWQASTILSGSGTVSFVVKCGSGGVTESAAQVITLTSTPTRYSIDITFALAGHTSVAVQILRNTGQTATTVTATNFQLENVTGQTNQNPGEYVKTTSAAVTKFFDYENPYTVDDNGVVTDSGVRTPLTTIKGILLEAASTNKVTAYGIIPADTLGSELGSGTLTIGQKYQITARTDADFTADGAADNNVGTQFVATAATVTLDAGDKVKRVQWGVGEKSFHNGSTFVQNITGLTLSGDTAAVLSIVTDETEITAAGLAGVNPTYKVYKLDNSGGSSSCMVAIAGTVGNTNPHSWKLHARLVAGSALWFSYLLADQSDFARTAETTYQLINKNNVTPETTARQLHIYAPATSVVHFLLPQLEESSSASSPIITAGATATRAATSLSYPTMGIWNETLSVEKAAPTDLTSGWTTASATVNDSDTFTTAGTGGVYRAYLTADRSYQITFTASSNTTFSLKSSTGGGTTGLIATTGGTYTFVASSANLYMRNESAGVTNFAITSLKEVRSIPSGSGTFYWTPDAVTGTTAHYLWGSYADASNYIGVFYDGTNVVFRKRVGGSNYDATKALTAVSGATYKVGWRINADYSTDIAVDSSIGTKNTNTTVPAATTTYQIGTDGNNGNGVISSQIKDFKLFRKALPESRL